MHAPKLESHGNTKKGGIVETNTRVFLMQCLLSGESYEMTDLKLVNGDAVACYLLSAVQVAAK